MKPGVLILSLCLNLALAGAAFRYANRPARHVQGPSGQSVSGSSWLVASHPGDSASTAPIEPVTDGFHWCHIESADYETYAANLRGVGCPEKTICEIIVADVERLYAARKAAVPRHRAFWSCGPARAASDRAREDQLQTLDAEKQAVLQQLLGKACSALSHERSKDLAGLAIISFLMGPLPDGVPRQAMSLLERCSDQESVIQSRANGIMLPADEALLATNSQLALTHLRELLPAGSLEEFAARSAALWLVDHGFEKFSVTSTELREIAGIHVSIFGTLQGGELNLLKQAGPSDEQKEEFEARLASFLGERRYAEYKRDNDSDFQALDSFADENHLPRETALQLYEVKQLVDSEARRLRADAALAPPELLAQWRALQETTREQLRQFLGDKALDLCIRSAGGWITNSAMP